MDQRLETLQDIYFVLNWTLMQQVVSFGSFYYMYRMSLIWKSWRYTFDYTAVVLNTNMFTDEGSVPKMRIWSIIIYIVY